MLFTALGKPDAPIPTTAQEKPEPESPLMKLPQVLVTPHMGAHTDGATNAMGWQALRDCLAVLRGEPATPVV